MYPVNFEKFEDAKDDVIDIAKASSLTLLGMVQAAGPIDGDISISIVQQCGGTNGTSCGGPTEIK